MRGLLGGALILLTSVAVSDTEQTAPGTSPDLPPLEMVHLLRQVRLAGLVEDSATVLAKLREASARFPQDPVPLLEFITFHRAHGLPDAEAASAREGLRKLLADPEIPIARGTLAALVDHPRLAESEARLILEAAAGRLTAHPDDARLVETVASLHLALEQHEEARGLFYRLLALRPDDPAVHRMCVNLAMRLERWEEVLRLMEPKIDQPGSDVFDAVIYVEALSKLGRHERAVARLDALAALMPPGEAESFRPTLKSLLVQIAWDMRDQGKDREAEAVFRRLADASPQDLALRESVLYLYGTEEEWARQESELKQRWEEEEDPHALLERGANLLSAGDATAALGLLERAAAQVPESEIAWFNLGLAAYQLERWELAANALARASEINPARAAAWLNRGAALQKLERCGEAVPILERALELQPDLFQAHFYLYACHAALGQNEKSLESLRRYREGRR